MDAKTVQVGPLALTLSAAAGVLTLKAALSGSLGGGAAAGVAKGSLIGEVDLGAQQAADLGLAALAVQFPSLSAEIDGLKVLVDAELSKV